ncbi:hypothetical protein KOR34_40730 [Posidoniimonas corsicana]|uniref:Polymer-forming cytoskeletal n=1 Tax=Posidoniimonas corsicana TaxID=1938618 RepID=A0A5C5V1P3_9BACT|nr:hypothetical protein [Posidoniimonas corsicana]TWT32311.1 hypothetical protein KOR34_40730 [Posidoniimonas corsicana]
MLPVELQRRVGYLDLMSGMAYPRSVSAWHAADEESNGWVVRDRLTAPVLIGENDKLLIDGGCLERISAPDGGLVHINGDLATDLEIGGHHELIIRGDIIADCTVLASGFHHVYVGGSVAGTIRVDDSSKLWIDGDFTGAMTTGHPTSRIDVAGDFSAIIRPTRQASLLYLSVGGFSEHQRICEIADLGYTEFNASIGASDTAPGYYPLDWSQRRTDKGMSHARWCVQRDSRAE